MEKKKKKKVYLEWITGKNWPKLAVLEAFVERIGGPQFLTDFDETWTNFFGRSISKISTVHFFYFLPHFFTKGLNVQLSVKISISDIWLPNIALYKKKQGKNQKKWTVEIRDIDLPKKSLQVSSKSDKNCGPPILSTKLFR